MYKVRHLMSNFVCAKNSYWIHGARLEFTLVECSFARARAIARLLARCKGDYQVHNATQCEVLMEISPEDCGTCEFRSLNM